MGLRAFLGGTFDPVHVGHLHAARAVARELGLSSATLVLSARPPHRSAIASVEDRWRMLLLAVEHEPTLAASDVELARSGPSYSIDTVRALSSAGGAGGGAELGTGGGAEGEAGGGAEAGPVVWVLGSDGLGAFHAWHAHEAFATSCHVAVLARPDAEVAILPGFREVATGAELSRRHAGLLYVAKTAMLDVSATQVRGAITRGEDASRLLTPAVWNYIRERGLYLG